LTRAAALGALLPLLAGCTSEEPTVRDERLRWATKALPSERAGKLDVLESGPLTAENAFTGSLHFEEVQAGQYDVYIACRGGWKIDVDITGERGLELRSATVLCDESMAVEVTSLSRGLTLTATAPNENTDWAVLVLPIAEDEIPEEEAPAVAAA
jgi:hypothetical protein